MDKHTGRTVVMAGGVGLSVLLSLAPAAWAETYTVADPLGGGALVALATNGDDAVGFLAISQGGCAVGSTAVAIGDPGRECGTSSHAIGLLGADSRGRELAASDTGTAASCTTGCWPVNFSVSGTGDASAPGSIVSAGISTTGNTDAHMLALSGTGAATSHSGGLAASGRGNATGGWISVSGTGVATGDTHAVSGINTAQTRGCSGDPVDDAIGGYAVSVTGDAYGCTPVSVTGKAVKTAA